MSELLAARSHTWNNQSEIEASTMCGCCSCLALFPPEEVVAWEAGDIKDFENLESLPDGTAMCPHCGSDSVIGDKSGFVIDPAFLTRMNEAWFQRTLIRPRPRA